MPLYPSTKATASDLLVAVNNKATNLTAGIDAVTLTIPVTSTTGFPAVGYISINNEIIHYTSIGATQFNADLRGADGSSAASHLINDQVAQNNNAAYHNLPTEELIAIIADLVDNIRPNITNLQNWLEVKRPNLKWISATEIEVEENTAVANETSIAFPDGTIRTVIEDTSSTHKYRRALITATSEYTSGTEDSGLESGFSETNNTWYMVFAVKSLIDPTKFVLTMRPSVITRGNIAGNFNVSYGVNGWVYLGTIRNGDSGAAPGDIIRFKQNGAIMLFRNTVGGNTENSNGIVSETAAVTAFSWTYSAGTGDLQIPDHITHAQWGTKSLSGGTTNLVTAAADTTIRWASINNSPAGWGITVPFQDVELGFRHETNSVAAKDIWLKGFIDGALSAIGLY